MNAEQKKVVDAMIAGRPDVKFSVSDNGKVAELKAEGWPTVRIGAKGGVDLVEVRSWSVETYPKPIDAALVADQLLAKQIGRDAKKAGVKKEEVTLEQKEAPKPKAAAAAVAAKK